MVTFINGISSNAPDADFANTPVSFGALCVVVTTAVVLKAAAERKMAPMLWGSVTWSRIIRVCAVFFCIMSSSAVSGSGLTSIAMP